MGEIHDEYVYEERTYTVVNDHTWIFEGKTLLTDFYKITQLKDEEFEKISGEADTVAGLVLEIKGEFPTLHEKLSYKNYDFEILAMDNRRILKVKFIVNPPQQEEKERWPCSGNLRQKIIIWAFGRWMNLFTNCCISFRIKNIAMGAKGEHVS